MRSRDHTYSGGNFTLLACWRDHFSGARWDGLEVPALLADEPSPHTADGVTGITGLPPFPTGWYCLGFSADVAPERQVTRTFMGREVVLFRTASGRLSVVEAHCPHLGAHLGHGGLVRGETLRCPFHGFAFEASGRCVSTPYGPTPRTARLDMLSSYEAHGLIFAYHGPSGEAAWRPEAHDDGWSGLPSLTRTWRFRGHVQDIAENSVDFGHFTALHKFTAVESTEPLTVDGPRIRAAYTVRSPVPLLPQGVLATFTLYLDGFGVTRTMVNYPTLGSQIHILLLPTPIDGTVVDLRLVLRLRTGLPTSGRAIAAAMVGTWPGAAVTRRAIFEKVAFELRRDMVVWKHQRHLHHPALAAGDGPIGKYRRWASQFYPQSPEQGAACKAGNSVNVQSRLHG